MNSDRKYLNAYRKMLNEDMPWEMKAKEHTSIEEEADDKDKEEPVREKPTWRRLEGTELVKDIRNRIKKYDPRLDRVVFWFLEDGDHHSLVTQHQHSKINKEDIRRISASPYFIEMEVKNGLITFKFFDDQGSLLEGTEDE